MSKNDGSKADHSEIPHGMYCYRTIRTVYGPPDAKSILLADIFGQDDKRTIVRRQTRVCPHWGIDRRHPRQANGFCRLTGIKDWVNHTLLWDQVKECGINKDDEDDE